MQKYRQTKRETYDLLAKLEREGRFCDRAIEVIAVIAGALILTGIVYVFSIW